MAGHCDLLEKGLVRSCIECREYPCPRLKRLDAPYRSRYHTSMIENLEFIRDNGIEGFLEKEAAKWRCAQCGGVI